MSKNVSGFYLCVTIMQYSHFNLVPRSYYQKSFPPHSVLPQYVFTFRMLDAGGDEDQDDALKRPPTI